MNKILCSKLPRSNIIKNNLLLKNHNKKDFSDFIKKTNLSSKDPNSTDFFETNFRLETPPNHMPTFNDMDTSYASEVFSKLDLDNLTTVPLINGKFSRLWCLTEDIIDHFVMFLTHDLNMGIGFSTIVLASLMRIVFYPLYKRNFKNQQLSRLMHPDVTELKEKAQKLNAAGERQLSKIEMSKLPKLQKDFGLINSPVSFVLNGVQILIFGCWTGLVQRFSFHVEDYPEMMTGGFLWFKDLSMTDPYFILPALNSFSIFLNAYGQNVYYTNPVMLKFRRFLFIAPLMSLTVMCTLETGIVFYFFIQSFMMFAMNYFLGTYSSRKRLGIPDYIPGSKLERLNKARLVNEKIEQVEIPHVEEAPMKEIKQTLAAAQTTQESPKKPLSQPGQQSKKEKPKESAKKRKK